MARYHAYARVVGTKYLGTVEADDVASAREAAWNLDTASVGLCHQCRSECNDAEIADVAVEQETEPGSEG